MRIQQVRLLPGMQEMQDAVKQAKDWQAVSTYEGIPETRAAQLAEARRFWKIATEIKRRLAAEYPVPKSALSRAGGIR